tara:strand:+ start:7380 stop:7757 length:378 start_codon:yes stop_codon:yes gene_type:complete
MNYNSDLQMDYDNDDDYRVSTLNAYKVVLEGDKLDDALALMFSRQQEIFVVLTQNNIVNTMLDEIVSNDKRGHWATSSPDYLFYFLHGYDFFKEFHNIICACIKKEDSLEELCDILKNKILNNIL